MIVSCNASRNSTKTGKAVTLKAIAKKPAKYEGKEIQIEGVYLGWKHGDCQFPASFCSVQITRSDWAFSDGKWCCFVTGSIPAGLESSPDNPVPIKLIAKVKRKDSKVYLEYVNSRLK
jgi:hypothetical protein